MAGAAHADMALSMSAGPGDLALAEISFAGAGARQRLDGARCRWRSAGPFGDDYLATAVLRPATKRGPAALVLLVNRPSPLLDPATVALRISARALARRAHGAQARRPVRTAPRRARAGTLRSAPRAALSASSLSVLGRAAPALTASRRATPSRRPTTRPAVFPTRARSSRRSSASGARRLARPHAG